MNKIEKLQEELKTAKEDYKVAKQVNKKESKRNHYALKNRYQKDIGCLQQQIKEIQKRNHQPFRFFQFLNKTPQLLDSAIMAICKPFERKVHSLRYKQSDPDGYEADKVLEQVEDLVLHFEKKTTKGKKLSSKDLEIITALLLTTHTIVFKNMGKRIHNAKKIIIRIEKLIPKQNKQNNEAAQAMLSQFEEMMKSI